MEYIGVDIGGTKCAVVRADKSGKILEKIRFDTADRNDTLARIFSAVNAMKTTSTASVGISCGGPLDSSRGMILSPPNLPGWIDVPIVEMMKEKTGLRAALCNDANACALAEWKFGAGRGTKNMVFLTAGTGMGAGLILDGRLYSGTCDMAGEVGHLRLAPRGPVGFGKEGSFEGFCSGGGIGRLARVEAEKAMARGVFPAYCKSRAELDGISAKSVAVAADAGDKTAINVYKKSGAMLGRALAVIVDIINPEMIVIGSVFQRSGHLLRAEMEKTLKKEAICYSLDVCRVVPAELGDSIGDVAAVTVAMEMA